MLFRCAAVLLLAIGGSACRTSSPAPASKPSAAAASAAAAARAPERFGSPIDGARKAEPIATVLANPERYQGRPVVVEGRVRRACSRRGCWMELAEASDPKLPGCRVTFKDYGFFVPTDSAGASARVEAELELATLNPASVDHMESEGASFPNKNSDGSAREVRLIASGVELTR
ncbi:MAG TPA: DUF4920 domain-containing protein [Polyangiaceae bacterium]|nr:DUF4920 domain-containing protein [Polyangiaceae bacterium]